MNKVYDLIKRRKMFIIIPLLFVFVIPSVLSFFFLRTYKAESMIWSDSNSLLIDLAAENTQMQTSATSPIEEHSTYLQQLIASRTFLAEVINKTSLKNDVKSNRDMNKTIDSLGKQLSISTLGPNSLQLTFEGKTPESSKEVVKEITALYIKWYQDKLRIRYKTATTFYKKQIAIQQKALAIADKELEKYEQMHPETKLLKRTDIFMTPADFNISPAVQSEYNHLQEARDYTSKEYNTALDNYSKATIIGEAQTKKSNEGLRIQDPPVEPLSFSLKPMLMIDALAFAIAVVIGVSSILLIESNNKVFRKEDDIRSILGLQTLAVIPVNKQKRSGKKPSHTRNREERYYEYEFVKK